MFGRVLVKTVRLKKKLVYRAQRIPFVTNINYLKGIFAQIIASVRARVIEFFLIGTTEVQGPLPVQGGGQPSGRQACSEAGQGVCWDIVDGGKLGGRAGEKFALFEWIKWTVKFDLNRCLCEIWPK